MPLSGSSFLNGLAKNKNDGENRHDNSIESGLTGNNSRVLEIGDTTVVFDENGSIAESLKPGIGDVVISENGLSVDSDGKSNYWNLFMEVEEGEGRNASILEITNTLFNSAVNAVTDAFSRSEAAVLFNSIVKGFMDYSDATGDTSVLNNSSLVTFIMEGPSAAFAESPDNAVTSSETAINDYIDRPFDNQGQGDGAVSVLKSIVSSIFKGNFGESGTLSLRSTVNNSTAARIFINGTTSGGTGVSSVYTLLINIAVNSILSRNQLNTVNSRSQNAADGGMPVTYGWSEGRAAESGVGASRGMPVINPAMINSQGTASINSASIIQGNSVTSGLGNTAAASFGL